MYIYILYEQVEDNGDDGNRHTNICQQYSDRERWKLHLPGTEMQHRDKNEDKEIQRRITVGCTAFAKHRDIFNGNIGTCLKRQIYNSCVLPVMTYGAERWAVTTHAKTKVTDVIEQVRRRTWTWAGHLSRIRDNRWTLRITTWKSYERKRPRGRPERRWRDEVDDYWKGTT